MTQSQFSAAPPKPRRSAARWMILLFAYAIGLAIWAVYLAGIGYLVVRTFGETSPMYVPK